MFPKRTSRFLIAAPATLIMLAGLAGCAQESARIDLTSYAPVIDVKGQGYDMADYQQDLNECRMLGVRVQAAYEAQQKKERDDAKKAAIVGAGNLDYSRDITKFGPTSIVDRCMTDRGYKILSAEGFGGG